MPTPSDIDAANSPEPPVPNREWAFAAPAFSIDRISLNGNWNLPRPLPASHELFLWLFRAGWRAPSYDDLRAALSPAELQRAKASPTAATAKRYLAGCMALRHIFSRLLACPPGHIEFSSTHEGVLYPIAPGVGSAIEVHVVHAGIWIMIGISAAPVGICATLPSLGNFPDLTDAVVPTSLSDTERIERARERATCGSLASLAGRLAASSNLHLSSHGTADIADMVNGRRLHAVDIPMPGQICGSIAFSVPVSTMYAIGWTGRWTQRSPIFKQR